MRLGVFLVPAMLFLAAPLAASAANVNVQVRVLGVSGSRTVKVGVEYDAGGTRHSESKNRNGNGVLSLAVPAHSSDIAVWASVAMGAGIVCEASRYFRTPPSSVELHITPYTEQKGC